MLPSYGSSLKSVRKSKVRPMRSSTAARSMALRMERSLEDLGGSGDWTGGLEDRDAVLGRNLGSLGSGKLVHEHT